MLLKDFDHSMQQEACFRNTLNCKLRKRLYEWTLELIIPGLPASSIQTHLEFHIILRLYECNYHSLWNMVFCCSHVLWWKRNRFWGEGHLIIIGGIFLSNGFKCFCTVQNLNTWAPLSSPRFNLLYQMRFVKFFQSVAFLVTHNYFLLH